MVVTKLWLIYYFITNKLKNYKATILLDCLNNILNFRFFFPFQRAFCNTDHFQTFPVLPTTSEAASAIFPDLSDPADFPSWTDRCGGRRGRTSWRRPTTRIPNCSSLSTIFRPAEKTNCRSRKLNRFGNVWLNFRHCKRHAKETQVSEPKAAVVHAKP